MSDVTCWLNAAEQSEPVRRKVTLKVIKLGMNTNQVAARFEAEWQALSVGTVTALETTTAEL